MCIRWEWDLRVTGHIRCRFLHEPSKVVKWKWQVRSCYNQDLLVSQEPMIEKMPPMQISIGSLSRMVVIISEKTFQEVQHIFTSLGQKSARVFSRWVDKTILNHSGIICFRFAQLKTNELVRLGCAMKEQCIYSESHILQYYLKISVASFYNFSPLIW